MTKAGVFPLLLHGKTGKEKVEKFSMIVDGNPCHGVAFF